MNFNDALTVTEVAQQYHVSERTVEHWIERGLLAEKASLQAPNNPATQGTTVQRYLVD